MFSLVNCDHFPILIVALFVPHCIGIDTSTSGNSYSNSFWKKFLQTL